MKRHSQQAALGHRADAARHVDVGVVEEAAVLASEVLECDSGAGDQNARVSPGYCR